MSEKALIKQELSLGEVQSLAQSVAKSGLFKGVNSPDAAFTLMMLCQAEGLHPIQAMMEYDIIEGKPSRRAKALLARFQERGGKVEWHERSDKACEATFTGTASTAKVRFTIEDAQKMGLVGKDNWRKQPRRMLTWRCVSEGVGITMPSLGLIRTSEEIEDEREETKGEKASRIWDSFEQQGKAANAEQPAPEAPQDAEFQDVAIEQPAPPPEQPAPDVFAMPGDDCDRVPAEIAHKSRKLSARQFSEQGPEELTATIAELDRLAKVSKIPGNRAAIAIVATFARQALEKIA